MLTGDSETTANAIAKETGIDEVYSSFFPDEKLAKLQGTEKQTWSCYVCW